jgi:hypothetical protein
MSIKDATFSLCGGVDELVGGVGVVVSLLSPEDVRKVPLGLLPCAGEEESDTPLERRNSVGVLQATQHLDNPSKTAKRSELSFMESTRITRMEVGWSTSRYL